MSEAIKPKCCGLVSSAGAWRKYTCGKNASMEHEGKHYCKTHHPPTVRAKREASNAKLRAEWDAQRVREQAARDAAAEQKRRADAYDQLVGRVKELEGVLRDAVDCGMVPKSSAADGGASKYGAQVLVADRIRAALSKSLPNAAAKDAGFVAKGVRT